MKHLLLLALLLAAAPTAADADVTIELLLRERQDARDAGAIGVPIGGMLVMVPTRETVKAIRVELRAGDATRVFDAANRTFGRAAKSLAEQIQSWCADNRAVGIGPGGCGRRGAFKAKTRVEGARSLQTSHLAVRPASPLSPGPSSPDIGLVPRYPARRKRRLPDATRELIRVARVEHQPSTKAGRCAVNRASRARVMPTCGA
jgi:hypothetical protein